MPTNSRKAAALRALCVIAIIAVFGVAAYSNTLNCPFAFDDKPNITENPFLRLIDLDLKSITAAAKGPCSHRPISYISFALNYYFGQYDVKGYHIVNIIIHIINGILIYLFASVTLRLAGRSASPLMTSAHGLAAPQGAFRISALTAMTAALLWLVHPVQIQSVTYIVQRMNSMAAMFYMLSLLFLFTAVLPWRPVGAPRRGRLAKPRGSPDGRQQAGRHGRSLRAVLCRG